MIKYGMISPKSLILSIIFSLFLYLEYFGLSIKLIITIFALSSFILLLTLSKKELFQSGFLIGIFWFWWIGLSFIHYELGYLIPIILLAIGLGYGILFFLIGLTNKIYIRVLLIFALSFIAPFGFNWLKPELLFLNSYLGVSKIEFFIILSISAILVYYKANRYSIIVYSLSITCLYFYNLTTIKDIPASNLKIYEYNTTINQEDKWKRKYKPTIVKENFQAIEDAINKKYDLIVLPETAFPFILNYQASITQKLLTYSKEIAIITGSLYQKDKQLYNSTYLFDKETIQVANKVVLVPFGEAVPFPEKIRNLINDIFYDGAQDYQVAAKPTTFTIKGEKFRNAICYEATTDKIFENLDTKYMIAISNNAWFSPSIEPTLQQLLLKYYGKKYGVYIYSISNS